MNKALKSCLREAEEKKMDDYTDDEWDNLTEEEQDRIRKNSTPDKGENSNVSLMHNKF